MEKRIGEYEIKVQYYEDAESPREWDHLGMICTTKQNHSQYDIGENIFKNEKKLNNHIDKIKKELYTILPIYMYNDDTNNCTISITPFSNQENSFLYGYIVTNEENPSILNILEKEIYYLNKWIRGEVYEYIIFKVETNSSSEEDYKYVTDCTGYEDKNECMKAAEKALKKIIKKTISL